MTESSIPLELISNVISFVIIIAIVRRIINYKRRISVIDGLYELQESKQLTDADKEFVKDNLLEYQEKFVKQEAFNKLMYPVFVFITAIFFLYFETAEAVIHTNIIVVSFIYVMIIKIHYKNYIKLLSKIKI